MKNPYVKIGKIIIAFQVPAFLAIWFSEKEILKRFFVHIPM